MMSEVGTSVAISGMPTPVIVSSGIATGAAGITAGIAGRAARTVFFRAGRYVAAFRPMVRPAMLRPLDDFVVDLRAADLRPLDARLLERRDLALVDFLDELAPFFPEDFLDDRPDDFFDVDFFAMWLLDG